MLTYSEELFLNTYQTAKINKISRILQFKAYFLVF